MFRCLIVHPVLGHMRRENVSFADSIVATILMFVDGEGDDGQGGGER